MKTARSITAALLLAASLPAAPTNDMRPVAILMFSMMCARQDPVYRSGLWTQLREARYGPINWSQLDSEPLSQCLRERKWLTERFCQSVNQVNIEDREQITAWFKANTIDIQKLDPAISFVNDVYGQRVDASSCPQLQIAR
jgi:hypothetical protein